MSLKTIEFTSSSDDEEESRENQENEKVMKDTRIPTVASTVTVQRDNGRLVVDKPAPDNPEPTHVPKPDPQPQVRQPAVPAPVSQVETKTYVVLREKKGLGKLRFKMMKGNERLFEAKAGKDMYTITGLGEEHVLLVGNGAHDFSLRKTVDSGETVVIRFSPAKIPIDNARRCTIFYGSNAYGEKERLNSKNPQINPDGKVQHDFGGRFAIDSVKNAVFTAQSTGQPMIMVRKAGKNCLEIDMKFEYYPILAFVVGIASFVCSI